MKHPKKAVKPKARPANTKARGGKKQPTVGERVIEGLEQAVVWSRGEDVPVQDSLVRITYRKRPCGCVGCSLFGLYSITEKEISISVSRYLSGISRNSIHKPSRQNHVSEHESPLALR